MSEDLDKQLLLTLYKKAEQELKSLRADLAATRTEWEIESNKFRAELQLEKDQNNSLRKGYTDLQIEWDAGYEVGRLPSETFEEAWARMEAAGYQYGEDALTNVRFGWELRNGNKNLTKRFDADPHERSEGTGCLVCHSTGRIATGHPCLSCNGTGVRS